MNFKKCSRCGNFYISKEDVCPKCSIKDSADFSTFKLYVEENGFSSTLETISNDTGISLKNLNRYVGYEDFKKYKDKNYTNDAKLDDINLV